VTRPTTSGAGEMGGRPTGAGAGGAGARGAAGAGAGGAGAGGAAGGPAAGGAGARATPGPSRSPGLARGRPAGGPTEGGAMGRPDRPRRCRREVRNKAPALPSTATATRTIMRTVKNMTGRDYKGRSSLGRPSRRPTLNGGAEPKRWSSARPSLRRRRPPWCAPASGSRQPRNRRAPCSRHRGNPRPPSCAFGGSR
jgi:hypothetical protein